MVSETTGYQIRYAGQSLASLTLEIVQRLLLNRRGRPPPQLGDELRRRQGNKCSICSCNLTRKAVELDHKVPLSAGGAEDYSKPDLNQLLCQQYHRRKSQKEEEMRVALRNHSVARV